MRPVLTISLLALTLLVAGCAVARPSATVAARAFGSAALFEQFAAYDTAAGRRLSTDELVRRLASADVVFFGESHGDLVCNQLQASLLDSLSAHAGEFTLAMEFFEADTQPALDAYIDGRLDERAFVEQTRQGRGYWTSHRPLIELRRVQRAPVLAANAPRRLVRDYRVSGLEYDEFLRSVSAESRRWLPASSERIGGAYERRFFALMGGHDGDAARESEAATPGPEVERFYRAQLLWDDAMAESVATHRERFPARRVVLIVGSFHVAHDGGAQVKYRARRPQDRTLSVVYEGVTDGALGLRDADRAAADIVIYGVTPPARESQ